MFAGPSEFELLGHFRRWTRGRPLRPWQPCQSHKSGAQRSVVLYLVTLAIFALKELLKLQSFEMDLLKYERDLIKCERGVVGQIFLNLLLRGVQFIISDRVVPEV